MEQYRKKRRPAKGPSKNELRASRSERDERARDATGTLRRRFPYAQRLDLTLRFEAASGAMLDESQQAIGPDDSLSLDAECPGGCGGGHFLLTDAIEAMLQARIDARDGMAVCGAASYNDPKAPCGTKLFYQISISYDESAQPPADKQGE